MEIKTNLIYLALALVTGALIPIQASTNAAFSRSVGSPLITGVMVFAVGFVGMILFVLISGRPLPAPSQFASAPAYGYLGGIIVASYVIMITILVPRVGVATAISFIVTGQIFCAVAIDHFGLFNTVIHPMNVARAIGMLLMIAGIYLVMKK